MRSKQCSVMVVFGVRTFFDLKNTHIYINICMYISTNNLKINIHEVWIYAESFQNTTCLLWHYWKLITVFFNVFLFVVFHRISKRLQEMRITECITRSSVCTETKEKSICSTKSCQKKNKKKKKTHSKNLVKNSFVPRL